jgi:hypothetical protein
MTHSSVLSVVLVATVLLAGPCARATERWTPEQANAWYAKQPWLVGSNFGPSTAINQLEMWQADTFDPKTIDRELGWAQDLGFTSMRVFLHHLLYEQDPEGFLKRLDQYLQIADKHKIGTMFVLFDSCWDPNPELGKQREPKKGVHNSGWVQSPGNDDLQNAAREPALEKYLKGVVGRFKDDKRVQVWDIWNEPDNTNNNSYGKDNLKTDLPAEAKHPRVLSLLPKAFAWARDAGATQPLTSGLWLGGHKADPKQLTPIEKAQLDNSDVITFHCYDPQPGMAQWVANLKAYNRPLLCTEYMARPNGSRFDPILGYLKEQKIAAYNWGFVAGKTNTIFAWNTWQKPEAKAEPDVWFHDIFRPDGSVFDKKEVEYIKSVTGAK